MPFIGKLPESGSFKKLDAISTVNGQAAYTMQSGSVNFSPASANHILVTVNGILQSATSNYTVSGSTITFTSALVTGDVINSIIVLGDVLNIGTPSSGTVGMSQLSATGTKDSTTFLRGDNSFAVPGGGKILQVVSLHNDQYATHSNTNVDAQAQILSQAITPSATSSKILLMGGVQVSTNTSSAQYYGLSIYRGSTVIGEGDKSSWNTGVGEFHSSSSYNNYSQADDKLQIHFVDSPNTTSATTYNIKCWINHFSSSLSNTTLVINGGGYNYNNKETGIGSSNLTLMEIGA